MSRPVIALLALALVLPLAGACHRVTDSQPRADARYAPEQLRADLAVLRDAVLRRHPRHHAVAPDVELVAAFETAQQALATPMTRAEAFRVLARVNPAYRDAHTVLMPTFATEAAQGAAQFPIAVRLGPTGELRVRGTWASALRREQLADGTRIVSINGENVDALLEDLAQYGHGETAALRRHLLTLMFGDWLAAVREWRGEFVLAVESGGSARNVTIGAADDWQALQPDAARDLPRLEDLGAGVALLRLPTFDVDDDPAGFRAAVDRAFAALRRTRAAGLIVDVRGNTGGQSDAGAHVIRYLANRPVNQVSRARERLHDGNRGPFGWKGRVGEIRELDLARDGVIEPAPEAQRFRGPAVVLIDAMTYSAAILFATTLQDHGLATVVGQPTGGHANQTGNMEPVTLPNTRLLAYVPAREFVRPSGDTRVGPVMPDVVVEASADERVLLQIARERLRASSHVTERAATAP